MAFKWKCCTCGRSIIVPYESPETMSRYATAYCPKCFKENIEICEQTGEFYQCEDENKNMINCYSDIDGMIFECSLEQQERDINCY